MTAPRAPRLALALLERFVPDSEPLAGDLVEEFEARPSSMWFWSQVLAAIAIAWWSRDGEIRPLRLVEVQPADAIERSRQLSLRFPPVNLSPMGGVGGPGLVMLVCFVTRVMPNAWWPLLASAVAGVVLGAVIIAARQSVEPPRPLLRIRNSS